MKRKKIHRYKAWERCVICGKERKRSKDKCHECTSKDRSKRQAERIKKQRELNDGHL